MIYVADTAVLISNFDNDQISSKFESKIPNETSEIPNETFLRITRYQISTGQFKI